MWNCNFHFNVVEIKNTTLCIRAKTSHKFSARTIIITREYVRFSAAAADEFEGRCGEGYWVSGGLHLYSFLYPIEFGCGGCDYTTRKKASSVGFSNCLSKIKQLMSPHNRNYNLFRSNNDPSKWDDSSDSPHCREALNRDWKVADITKFGLTLTATRDGPRRAGIQHTMLRIKQQKQKFIGKINVPLPKWMLS